MSSDALGNVVLVACVILGVILIAWLLTYMVRFFRSAIEIQVSTGVLVKEPLHVSVAAYLLVVGFLALITPMITPVEVVRFASIVLPGALVGFIPIALINQRYYQFLRDHLGKTTTVRVITSYSALYWLGLVCASAASTFLLFKEILSIGAMNDNLYFTLGPAGYDVFLFCSAPAFLLLFHQAVLYWKRRHNVTL